MKLKLKDIFNWLKNIYGLFLSFVNITYKTCNDKVDLFYFYCQSIFPQKKIWIFDACDYGNLGDQAILYAQIKYLKKINYEGKNNGSYTIKGTQDEEET